MVIILSNVKRFTKDFTGRFLAKFAVKWLLKILPLPTYVAALSCENINVGKKRLTIYYKCSYIFKV